MAGNRQTEELPSVIFFFVVCSHHEHPKYLERELNLGHCFSHYFFVDFASVIVLLCKVLVLIRAS